MSDSHLPGWNPGRPCEEWAQAGRHLHHSLMCSEPQGPAAQHTHRQKERRKKTQISGRIMLDTS